MSLLEKARDELTRLFDAYMAATGASPTSISLAVAKDSKFYAKLKAEKHDLLLGTVDAITAKFSAIWPGDTATWPEGIDRPFVADSERGTGPRGRSRKSSLHPEWSDQDEWPADVPRPEPALS